MNVKKEKDMAKYLLMLINKPEDEKTAEKLRMHQVQEVVFAIPSLSDEKKRLLWGPGGEDVTASPDGLESAWYVRAEGTAEELAAALPGGTALARADAPAGEAARLTPPMTRPTLEARLAGWKVRSLFRVLD